MILKLFKSDTKKCYTFTPFCHERLLELGFSHSVSWRPNRALDNWDLAFTPFIFHPQMPCLHFSYFAAPYIQKRDLSIWEKRSNSKHVTCKSITKKLVLFKLPVTSPILQTQVTSFPISLKFLHSPILEVYA